MGAKFEHLERTATGEERARVELRALGTLWFNTGTRCNLTCRHCYLESSPSNDRLDHIGADEVGEYLDEVERGGWGTRRIGFTGGEPFVHPRITVLLETCLVRGYEVLVLTDSMRPMMRWTGQLLALRQRYGDRLCLRASLDHYTQERHEQERGPRAWAPAVAGLQWLAANRFRVDVAGRTRWEESEASLRQGYSRLFARLGVPVDAFDPARLVLFPELDEDADVPEITTACWAILGVSPDAVMCASSRMVAKRRDADWPTVVACTLLPYDARFELGRTLAEAAGAVHLAHPHCARFCVLGAGSCAAA